MEGGLSLSEWVMLKYGSKRYVFLVEVLGAVQLLLDSLS